MIRVDCEKDHKYKVYGTIDGSIDVLCGESAYVVGYVAERVTVDIDTPEAAIETIVYFLENAFRLAAIALADLFKDDQEKKMTALAGLMTGLDCSKGAAVEASGKTMGELQRYLFENVRLNKKEEES